MILVFFIFRFFYLVNLPIKSHINRNFIFCEIFYFVIFLSKISCCEDTHLLFSFIWFSNNSNFLHSFFPHYPNTKLFLFFYFFSILGIIYFHMWFYFLFYFVLIFCIFLIFSFSCCVHISIVESIWSKFLIKKVDCIVKNFFFFSFFLLQAVRIFYTTFKWKHLWKMKKWKMKSQLYFSRRIISENEIL